MLLSFDVVSLFSQIPTDLAIDVVRRRLEDDNTLSERTTLTINSITTLLEFCLKTTYLMYQIYQKTFETAMGSPVSVAVANLVMEEIEQQTLSTFERPPRFWKR